MVFKNTAALLDGVNTEFIVSIFEDTIFIVITQNSKLGTLYLFKPECSKDQEYDLQVLFGREDDNLTSMVVSLMRAINIDRRAIISLMLDNTYTIRTIRAIEEVLSKLI
ncbi:Proteasome assembly chaperone 3 [Cinara cedri]|uniref:Proteasome assembly chaperone 3 n=1 Tax=Cinara cedri TaxID=506608 RepID=A0A5E4MSK3_9HEMI|nr:Proteasome assembly chaperone 3 [Cinara cedri]